METAAKTMAETCATADHRGVSEADAHGPGSEATAAKTAAAAKATKTMATPTKTMTSAAKSAAGRCGVGREHGE
jgi:hypothetical protein